MNLNSNLSDFLKEQILDSHSEFRRDELPVNVRSYVETQAQAMCGINRMVSTDDIIANWGTVEKFQNWKDGQVIVAEQINLQYLIGKIDGLIWVWKQNQLENGVDPDDMDYIDSKEFAQKLINQ